MVMKRAKNIKFDEFGSRRKKNFGFQNLKKGKSFLNIEIKRNKRLQIFFQDDEISISIKRRRNVVLTNDNSFNKTFQFKRQYSVAELKSTNLNFDYNKNYKEFKN